MNLNSPESIVLYCNEPMFPLSIALDSFLFGNNVYGTKIPLSPSNRQVRIVNVTNILINISSADIYLIKDVTRQTGILNQLYFTENAIKDFSGNSVLSNIGKTPILINSFTPDISPPYVVFFLLLICLLVKLFYNTMNQ